MAIDKSVHSICILWGLDPFSWAGKGSTQSCSRLIVRQWYVFWQNLHAQCEDDCIRRKRPRAFIWYVYCKGSFHLARQERALGDSVPTRVTSLNPSSGHNSATNWRSMLIQMSLDSCAGGAARAGSPTPRPARPRGRPGPAVVGGRLRVIPILPESGTKLPRIEPLEQRATKVPSWKVTLIAFPSFLGPKTQKNSTLEGRRRHLYFSAGRVTAWLETKEKVTLDCGRRVFPLSTGRTTHPRTFLLDDSSQPFSQRVSYPKL